MRYWTRLVACLAAVACVFAGPIGCARSSHRTVRVYQYDDEPPRDRQDDDQLDSEYKMVSPGEMVGPGEMVDE
ncbi:MAG: hypothetical protein ACE5HE_01920 [Phycisphaerae bacterium]